MSLKKAEFTFDTAQDFIGDEIAVSDWFDVTQEWINRFGDATQDTYWIHTDPARAAQESPYKNTIAHGFGTLSMLTHFSYEVELWPAGVAMGVNYGLNRVRWIAEAPVNSRIRGRFTLKAFEPHSSGGFVMTTDATIDVEGREKPTMVAEWLGMFYPEEKVA